MSDDDDSILNLNLSSIVWNSNYFVKLVQFHCTCYIPMPLVKNMTTENLRQQKQIQW